MTIPITKKEFEKWLTRYGEVEPGYQREVERRLTESFRSKGFADKGEVIELLNWKFDTMKGRLKRQLNLIKNVPEEQIIEKTREAFQNANEIERIKTLRSIKCVGNATCSVILTFYDPNRYCVFDIHVWRELFGIEPKHYDSARALIQLFEKVRSISDETELTCREVEKALFTKNYLESK